ncbi:MAG: hypothetical protein F4Z10_00435 [Synechococcus sp. SB0666_bin_14]|nr:hypothetical protein [Synechococcus sp. SB0666_bin_14]MYG47043.1 hypothetical protein [Synechococcus sp. SB0675_bin_6]MYJ59993.1 hypothetical protein [Synechococcus sp. SB0672_bin_6]
MSRFFSRLLIAPAVAGFFLLPHRGSAQVKRGFSRQPINKQEVETSSSVLSDFEKYDMYIEQDSDLSSFQKDESQSESTREYFTSNIAMAPLPSMTRVTSKSLRRMPKKIFIFLLIPILLFDWLFWYLKRSHEDPQSRSTTLKVGLHKTLSPSIARLLKGPGLGQGTFSISQTK